MSPRWNPRPRSWAPWAPGVYLPGVICLAAKIGNFGMFHWQLWDQRLSCRVLDLLHSPICQQSRGTADRRRRIADFQFIRRNRFDTLLSVSPVPVGVRTALDANAVGSVRFVHCVGSEKADCALHGGFVLRRSGLQAIVGGVFRQVGSNDDAGIPTIGFEAELALRIGPPQRAPIRELGRG